MDDKYCRGYRIRVRSVQSGSRWHTEVFLYAIKDAKAPELVVGPHRAWSATTEDEADQYGLAMAKAWIARRSNQDSSVDAKVFTD